MLRFALCLLFGMTLSANTDTHIVYFWNSTSGTDPLDILACIHIDKGVLARNAGYQPSLP
jgi:hypothetical protein